MGNKRHTEQEQHDLDERKEPEHLVKTYPSLPYGTDSHLSLFAFDKLDGSNVRAEWTKKKGWTKFGTRHRLVDASDPVFGKVPDIIVAKYGDSIPAALQECGWDKAMCFFEFWGPGSFAGMHDPKATQTVTLFDVAPYREGILDPAMFMGCFGHLDVPRVLLANDWVTPEFIESVRASTLTGMTFEGVVFKTKNNKKTKQPIMFKQKSRAWLDKLGEYCGENKELFTALI